MKKQSVALVGSAIETLSSPDQRTICPKLLSCEGIKAPEYDFSYLPFRPYV